MISQYSGLGGEEKEALVSIFATTRTKIFKLEKAEMMFEIHFLECACGNRWKAFWVGLVIQVREGGGKTIRAQ